MTSREADMLKHTIVLVLLVPLLGLVSGCGDDGGGAPVNLPETSEMTVSLVDVEGCKTFTRGEAGSDRSCVQYTYDPAQRTLRMLHVNAGFNCCPEEFGMDVRLEGEVITVTESEVGPNCRCNCLYDLDILIEHVPAASYRVVFEEPYRSEKEEAIDFRIDLAAETAGEHCVPRSMYPWGD